MPRKGVSPIEEVQNSFEEFDLDDDPFDQDLESMSDNE